MNETAVPNIVPLFRSEVQFSILGELFTHPDLELAVGELAERIGHPRPTVSHEVRRLVEAGLVLKRRQGNRSLLRADMTTPVSEDIRSLLSKTYGPLPAIRAAFAGLPVEYVAVFGSFAARWSGVAGPPPNDIDVVVVGDLNYEVLWDLTARLSHDLGIDVNAVLRAPGTWDDDATPFAEAIKQGHLIDLVGTRS